MPWQKLEQQLEQIGLALDAGSARLRRLPYRPPYLTGRLRGREVVVRRNGLELRGTTNVTQAIPLALQRRSWWLVSGAVGVVAVLLPELLRDWGHWRSGQAAAGALVVVLGIVFDRWFKRRRSRRRLHEPRGFVLTARDLALAERELDAGESRARLDRLLSGSRARGFELRANPLLGDTGEGLKLILKASLADSGTVREQLLEMMGLCQAWETFTAAQPATPVKPAVPARLAPRP